MNVWKSIDTMLERYRRELRSAKSAGRRTGYVKVRCATTGVWSARRASRFSGGVFEIHERSCDELIVGMFLGRHRGEFKRAG